MYSGFWKIMEWTLIMFQKSPLICILVDGCVSTVASVFELVCSELFFNLKCKSCLEL